MKNKNLDTKPKHVTQNNSNIVTYLKDGKLHCEDGPALIEYYDNGSVRFEEYYKDGKPYTESEYIVKTRKNKIKNILKK